MAQSAEDVIRDWWYSQSRAQALTSKEAAAGLLDALSKAGYVMVRAEAAEQSERFIMHLTRQVREMGNAVDRLAPRG